ncbi:MAG: phage tail protein, partial [Glaciecola sp.]
VKSTTEPYKIIYGETLVSGPISFIGMKGTNNEDLYHVIALAGHEVTDITDIYFDNELISDSAINSGSSAGGNVTSGIFGPRNSTTICIINKHLGTATQAADSMMVNAFTDYTSAHQGKGIAYIAMKWKLNEDSAEVWEKYAPSDIKAIVKGKPVYDPRLDTGGVGNNPADDNFITYSATVGSYVGQGQNPALILADYLINDDFGMGIASSKIDWNAIVTAANGCDVSVDVPNNATEKRFTCNGVLFGTDSHRRNITKILSSMNGSLVYSNGKYVLHAGIFEAATEDLNEDDLIAAIGIKTSFERSDRFNTIKGLFVDPAQNHKSSEFPKVQLADAVNRDNQEILEKEVQYPMTNSSYMAQRLSYKLIKLSDQQKVVSFPANLSALRIKAGDRVRVSVEELSWSNKVFQCVGWTFSDEGGVNLTLREDAQSAYDDPSVTPTNEYSTITASGDITDAFRGVPSPSSLSATAGLKNIELNWVNPLRPADYGTIYVYASPNSNFSSAVKIG